MKILINYADKRYEPARKWNTFTGRHIARFDKVYEFHPEDVKSEFAVRHSEILSHKRGNGLWLWKPYFVNKVMEDCNDGDIIFYCDSGAIFVRNLNEILTSLTNETPLFVCDIPLIESCFTKAVCFEKFGLQGDRYTKSNQIIATYFCFLVTPQSRIFMREWLSSCCDYELISPAGLGKNDCCNKVFGDSFVAHREDQSLFSLLCKKYNIIPHRDISQRGLHPETYKSPFYAYKVPIHVNDKYKPVIFLHKSPRLDFKWLVRYVYHSIRA